MSYILDALKRADSERERGVVPGLHAQPVPLGSSNRPARRASATVLTLIGVGIFLMLCVVFWRWQGVGSPRLPATAVTLVPPNLAGPTAGYPPPPPAPAPEARVMIAKPAPVISTPPTTPAQLESGASQAPAPQRPRMVVAPAQITAAASPITAQLSSTAPQAALAPPTPAITPATPPARISPLAELPADLRLAIPKIVISGSTYADNPAYRMLIINGQVVHEGEKLTPDLQLERIGPKSAVLNYKGQRYSVGY